MDKQLFLFPVSDVGDQSFELKRARKHEKRREKSGDYSFIITFPYRHVAQEFVVSKTTGGEWHCQDHLHQKNCHHVRALKYLLSLKPEGITEKAFLKKVLPVGDVR